MQDYDMEVHLTYLKLRGSPEMFFLSNRPLQTTT